MTGPGRCIYLCSVVLRPAKVNMLVSTNLLKILQTGRSRRDQMPYRPSSRTVPLSTASHLRSVHTSMYTPVCVFVTLVSDHQRQVADIRFVRDLICMTRSPCCSPQFLVFLQTNQHAHPAGHTD